MSDTTANYRQIVAAALRSRRQAQGLSQAEMSRRTGIVRPNICRIESGKHTPAIETLARLCAALGCTIGDLFASEQNQVDQSLIPVRVNSEAADMAAEKE